MIDQITVTHTVVLDKGDYGQNGRILAGGWNKTQAAAKPLVRLGNEINKIAQGKTRNQQRDNGIAYSGFEVVPDIPDTVGVSGSVDISVTVYATCAQCKDTALSIPVDSVMAGIRHDLEIATNLYNKVVISDERSSRYSAGEYQLEGEQPTSFGSPAIGKLYHLLHGFPGLELTLVVNGDQSNLTITDYKIPMVGENSPEYTRRFRVHNSAPDCPTMHIVTHDRLMKKEFTAKVIYCDSMLELFRERTLGVYEGKLTPYRPKSSRIGKHGHHYWLSKALKSDAQDILGDAQMTFDVLEEV